MNDLLSGLLSTVAFAALGLVLLVVGFYVIDLLTPGKLGQLIFVEHRRDPALLLGSSVLAIATIVATSIYTAETDTLHGLAETAAYGLVGIALLAVAFVILDLLTPGRLGELMTDDKDDPAIWVTVAVQLAVGVIVAASIT
ncbi:DUF350 domain-containing protein [Nocardioides albus]|uniref:Uncharacterized membrane protein YjfL (UPF0719 family) n=1 Tax=Nocardioides albus TaxID=1841 RepID=A0A7W5A8B2_9ACTN|nr:DUF350 domain-containing protein [Nocardioides albus]MBB3091562.1 uncharacterized membrane protein YjfL (UPF0719 family) [Nocardioides albus]GGU40916.1 UPF0719 transmembrane protein [Nocardioides albus]